MAEKSFGIKELNLIGASGTPTIESPNDIVFNSGGSNERLRINSSGELISTNGTLRRNVNDSSFTVSGDTASNAGANINLYGASHSSLANVFRVRTGSSERLRIDSSGRLLKSGQAALTSTSLSHPVQIAADSDAQNIVCFGRASDDISAIDFYEADKSTLLGELQYRRDHLNLRHRVGYISFATGGTTERVQIQSNGQILFSGSSGDNQFTSRRTNAAGSNGDYFFHLNAQNNSSTTVGSLGFHRDTATDDSRFVISTQNTGGSNTERLRIESDGQVVINRSSGAVLTNTSSKLEVFNSTENLIFVSNSTAATGQDAGIMFGPANNVYGGKIIVTSDEDFSTSANRTAHMAFHTRQDGTASERLRIASDGDVRIGDYNTVNRNAGLSVNKSDSRLFEMRCGSGTETNFVKRYGFAFVRSTSEATYNLVSLGSVSGNSHVVIQIRMYAVSAVTDQAAIITAYATARQQHPGTSYTYNVQTPTIEKFVVGTGIGVGSLSWSSGVLQYTTDANNNYTKYNTEITAWAHDRMDIGFY